MLVSIFDQMEQCTEEEVARLLPLVTEQRREQALRYRHTFGRFACLKSHLMLCELVGKRELVFTYTAKGKPLLRGESDICASGAAAAGLSRPPFQHQPLQKRPGRGGGQLAGRH